MPTTATLLLLAMLPIGQVADSPKPVKQPGRRTLAPENEPAGTRMEPAARRAPPDDACLHDVAFPDPRHGWAVGDHGVILHTDDGGQHWLPQTSGVTCTLNSIFFIDARNGWAAGGMAFPFLHDTAGVVLSTRDGGLNWQREPAILPALHKIRFVTDRQGWAIGCSSAMYTNGLFVTRDGGRGWQPAASGGGAIGLTTGDLYDGRNAILGGSRGRLATLNAGEFARQPAAAVAPILPGIHAMQAVPPSYGWLAGDGGWVALTGDRGNSWRSPLGKMPACAALFDFTAIAVRGGKCWIAGTPGSRIFSTPDAGRTWTAASSGSTVPLEAIAFADDDHGWAVGQLGTILATSDGGKTWQRQRAAGPRAAVMFVAGRAEDLPLELIARVCKDQGYFGVGEVIGREDVDAQSTGDAPLRDRLHQALLHAGACAGEMAWGFPVRPAELQLPTSAVLEGWNRHHDGHAADILVGHLVRQIRTWRPDVLVIADGRNGDGLAEIVRQSASSAFKLAADPAYVTDSFRAAGCEPWTVQRLYSASAGTLEVPTAISADEVSPRLGQSWTDVALAARGLLARDDRGGPAAIGVKFFETQLSRDPRRGPQVGTAAISPVADATDIMSDVTSSAKGYPRRPKADSQGSRLDGLSQRRQVDAAFRHLEEDPDGFLAKLTKGEELPQGIDAEEAAVLTFRIAETLRHSGRWDLADKAFTLLIERHPESPLARWAIVWRLQNSVSDARSASDAFARQVEMACPDLFASPAVRYPLAAYYRGHGQDVQARRFYVLDHRGVDRDAWWSCGHGEQWLADRKGPAPRSLVACVAASERPHLDGRLDEPLWKKCAPIELKSPRGDDSDWPATILLAHDEQFLYVAVRCRQAPGARYETTKEQRIRDADLSQHDRVDILLDVDRTYASYYQLTLDHRGWAADAHCGDRSWNPKWFVAAETADGTWTAEAAIPLADLGAAIVPGKTVWAVGLQRIVPGVGFQSWTAPAAPEAVPEGFGWVEFE